MITEAYLTWTKIILRDLRMDKQRVHSSNTEIAVTFMLQAEAKG